MTEGDRAWRSGECRHWEPDAQAPPVISFPMSVDLVHHTWSPECDTVEVEVIEIRKEKLGPAQPSTLTSMNNLAFTW